MNRRQRRQAAKTATSPPASSRFDLEQVLAAAVQHQQAGRLREAETLYSRILKANPKHSDALHLSGVLAFHRGQNERAVQLMKRAIAINGTNAPYHCNLGEVYRIWGRFEAAIVCYHKALSLDPEIADGHYNLANALFDLERFDEATTAFRKALALAPFDPEIHNNLGNALAIQGQPDTAIQHYRKALSYRSNYIEAQVNLANTLTDLGQLDEAVETYRKILAVQPELAQAQSGLGRALKTQGRFKEALQAYRQAAVVQPESAAAAFNVGNCLLNLERWMDAADAFRQALEQSADYALAYAKLGYCLEKQGFSAEAMDKLQRAIKLDPGLAEAHFYLGTCLQNQGRFEEAIGCHQQALEIQPDLTEAAYSLASIKQASDEDLQRLTRLLQKPLSLDARINVNFALAKIHEDGNRIDQAFQYYQAANTLKSEFMSFDPAAHVEYTDRLIETFSTDFFVDRQGFGIASELPVFIVGMPRSGTTLVEQILASHPQAFGAGELDDIRLMVRNLPEQAGSPFPACAITLEQSAVAELAQTYLHSLKKHAPQAVRISDKMLGNFLRLGLIALLFPKARIIHCLRDPLDTCLSCYFQHFAHGLRFTYDLQHMGLAYQQYERLMAHWQQVLPLPILNVQYEDLVHHQERVSRRLIEFCGLPWDDRCLNFYRQERQVQTASFWQVRQPMYASSVGRWRAYAKHLGPLISLFEQERLAS